MNTNSLAYKSRVFKIKLLNWEYWPMWLVYFPVGFYYLYLSLKARSFFFFSAVNPSIETGGMFFESKWKIFELLPKKYFPKTILITPECSIDNIYSQMSGAIIAYPIIAKPDRGERGWCVKILHNNTDLIEYKKQLNVSFLIQEYVDYSLEFSVFYYRHPQQKNGFVTSVTLKKMLTIVGNGQETIEQLILKNNRAFLQLKKLKDNADIDFKRVLALNEELILVPYGNHVRGAMFLNYNHIIDQQLTNTFNNISTQIDDFYFGRFDLRCTSIEDLKQGKNIAILELNGSGAEPAHIYDPNFSFFKAQKVLAQHYKMMFAAAIENNKKGVDFMTYKLFSDTKKAEKAYKNKVAII